MLLIITIVLVIAGISIVSEVIYKKYDIVILGYGAIIFAMIDILCMLACIPILTNHFTYALTIKERYDALQYRISSCTVDQTDLKNIQNINEEIQDSKDLKDDLWISVFCTKGIEDYEFLDYPKALKIYAENLLKEAK